MTRLAAIPLVLVNALGLAAFAAPFLLSSPSVGIDSARAADAPWITALMLPLLLVAAVSQVTRGRLGAKAVALLGVLAALAAVSRLPLSFAGANLFFLIPLTAAFVFGPAFGFLLGTLGLAASALITGGIGPWLPFQMFAAGWVSAGAGLLGIALRRSRAGVGLTALALYGATVAFVYGALMNLYFWPVISAGDAAISWQPGLGISEAVYRYRAFYLLTSAGWDGVGAVANAILVLTVGRAIIPAMKRYRERFSFSVEAIPTPSGRICASSGNYSH